MTLPLLFFSSGETEVRGSGRKEMTHGVYPSVTVREEGRTALGILWISNAGRASTTCWASDGCKKVVALLGQLRWLLCRAAGCGRLAGPDQKWAGQLGRLAQRGWLGQIGFFLFFSYPKAFSIHLSYILTRSSFYMHTHGLLSHVCPSRAQ
jgi:hypothetical protein